MVGATASDPAQPLSPPHRLRRLDVILVMPCRPRADGIPNNAERVIKIVPATGEVTTIGPPLGAGGYKWHGGVVASDGTIVGIPAHADCALKIVPDTDEVQPFGGPLGVGCYHAVTKYLYGGGVAGSDGEVYALPADADRVLRLVPATEEAVLVGGSLNPGESARAAPSLWQDKWQNGYLAADGAIYGIPVNGSGVLRIVPAAQPAGVEVSVVGTLSGGKQWEGGVVAGDGNMYCVPLRSKHVLKIVPGCSEGR